MWLISLLVSDKTNDTFSPFVLGFITTYLLQWSISFSKFNQESFPNDVNRDLRPPSMMSAACKIQRLNMGIFQNRSGFIETYGCLTKLFLVFFIRNITLTGSYGYPFGVIETNWVINFWQNAGKYTFSMRIDLINQLMYQPARIDGSNFIEKTKNNIVITWHEQNHQKRKIV